MTKLSLSLLLLAAATHHMASTACAANWPSFRGPSASGVAQNQNLPDHWNGITGSNILWKSPIPGLAHASPIVWDDKIFLTSAVSSLPEADFKPGLYGAGTASSDRSVHQWNLYCLHRLTGEILWTKTATQGRPRDKRHIKATYANATPATDGQHVITLFGSEGLFAFDLNGTLLWKKNLGRLDVGAYDLPSYEWGSASSPIIYQDKVIVQCDSQKNSFIIALNVKTGETIWKTPRNELPSWGTPTIVKSSAGTELVTNGSNYICGYDPDTGKELWKLGGSSKITAPTPIFANNLIIVTSGRSPERPIFAIRPGARGDITLDEDATSNRSIAWSKVRRGPYMPTPVAYDNSLYVLGNNGLFDVYDLNGGKDIYRERIPHRGHGFSASPVAADGKIFLPSENGHIFVVNTGPAFSIVATNVLGENIMATPAISSQHLYVRGHKSLFAISNARF